ncbi:MAG: hypothetical protein ABIG70_09845 [Pseudomonadota bacterium]
MKNPAQERFRVQMKQYHQSHPWRLEGGLYVPHAYPEPLEALSWWDDLGFILNSRRVMIWWIHPRMKYVNRMQALAWQEVGVSPLSGGDIFGPSETIWKKAGRSRKKVIADRTGSLPKVMQDYYARFNEIKKRLESDGIDFVAHPSIKIRRLSWCTGVDLCLPIEVRNREEIRELAELARRLVIREIALNNEYPEYQYGKQDWLAESEARNLDRTNRNQAG